MSLGQIAEKIELPRSTVQRIVGALQAERLVMSSPTGGGIRLGPELLSLGGATRYSIVDLCRPFLEKLSVMTGETVDLSVLRRKRMIFLDQVQGQHRLRTISFVGEEFPLTTTANGRACLAKLTDSEIKSYAESEWRSLKVNGNLNALREQIREVRKLGIAFDLDDHTSGVSAVGISFVDNYGDIYAISVPIPSTRYEEKSASVITALSQIKSELAIALV